MGEKVNYTISAAWVIETDADRLGQTDSDPLHLEVVNHLVSMAELMRVRFPDRTFRVLLTDLIFAAPEREIGG